MNIFKDKIIFWDYQDFLVHEFLDTKFSFNVFNLMDKIWNSL